MNGAAIGQPERASALAYDDVSIFSIFSTDPIGRFYPSTQSKSNTGAVDYGLSDAF